MEEKLKIPVRKLPLSKEVKVEFERKSVYSLRRLYEKFQRLIDTDGSMMVYLPGFTREAYNESLRLLSALELLPEDNRCSKEYVGKKIYAYVNKEA